MLVDTVMAAKKNKKTVLKQQKKVKKTCFFISSVHIMLVLDASFVPNLTFFGLLNPEISFGE